MWWFVAVFVVSLVISFAIPKPQIQVPAAVTEITAPTAEVGREIGVLFGTRDLSGPNVVWWGDLRIIPIKKKGGKK